MCKALLGLSDGSLDAGQGPELERDTPQRPAVPMLCPARAVAGADAVRLPLPAVAAGARRITHVISQSDVVHFLHKHVAELGQLGDVSLAALGLARKAVVCVPGEMSTINAFASMVVRGLTANAGLLCIRIASWLR